MLNGRVINSERPGHTILEGEEDSVRLSVLLALLILSRCSPESPRRGRRFVRVQLPRCCIWLV
jgi:hypothetical protein